jgi:iron complex outermembrane receptor protein
MEKPPFHCPGTMLRGAAFFTLLLLWSVGATCAKAETELPEVQVTDKKEVKPPAKEGSAESGYRSDSASFGALGNIPLQDTPFSTNVTPGELIENRQVHTLFDALLTNPTVTNLMSSNTYSSMSRVMIRGFTAADQDELRDGLVDRSFTAPPLENVERIEVMNGLSSFLYGFSESGGLINYVSKQPSPKPLASVAVGQYGGGINYAHADFGGPIPYTNDRLTTRFNAYKESGDTYINGSYQQRTLLSSALAYKLLPGTVLKGDIYYQKLDIQGLQTYFNANGGNWTGKNIIVPSASSFDPSLQYGQSYTYDSSEKALMGAGLESKLSDHFTFRGAYRFGTMYRQYQYVDATLSDNAGNYSESFTATPRQHEWTHSEYALIDASFDTWKFRNKLTFGYVGTDYSYKRGTDITKALAGSSNIDSPASIAEPSVTLGSSNTYQQQFYDNYVLGDRVEFTDYLSAMLGVCYGQLVQKAWGPATSISTSTFNQGHFSPSVALIYKPVPQVSTYASYMQGLANGGTAPTGSANATQILGPSVSDQYEVGVKTTLGNMNLAAALFYIDVVNDYVDPSDNVYKADGREVHKGIEVTASGKIIDHLTFVGGFTLLRAYVDNVQSNPSLNGNIPINVPEQQARAYFEYELPFVPHLTASLGANYYGKRPVDSANANYMPDATTFDTGLRYQPLILDHKATLILNVSNFLDRRYWTYYRSGDGLLLGEPRLFAFSAKVDW